jgi:hypothetical protein
MKRLLFILAVFVSLPVAMVAQVTHVNLAQNAEFASISETTSSLSSFSLDVGRNVTNTSSSANINFSSFAFAFDFSSLTIVNIIGAIPAGDFTGQSTSNLALNFSTADLDPSNSISQTCTLDLVTFDFTCGAGPTGTISLTFSGNNAQRTQVLALEEVVTLGNLTTRTHQRSDNGTATAQGTVFGTTVMGASATVGVNRTRSICSAIAPDTCP